MPGLCLYLRQWERPSTMKENPETDNTPKCATRLRSPVLWLVHMEAMVYAKNAGLDVGCNAKIHLYRCGRKCPDE